MPISNELIDQLLKDCHSPQDLLGKDGLLKELIKCLAERVLAAEMTMPLGYAKHDSAGNNSGNSRNGKTSKNVRSAHGTIELNVPRNSTFQPRLISKGEKQFNGFDERIISLYSRGLSVRDMQAYSQEVYGVEVSMTFISQVTNTVMEEMLKPGNNTLWIYYILLFLLIVSSLKARSPAQ